MPIANTLRHTAIVSGAGSYVCVMVRVFLQDLPANAVKSRVSDSQYTVLTTKLNIFHLSKCFDYKRIRAFFVLPHRFHCSLFMRIVT